MVRELVAFREDLPSDFRTLRNALPNDEEGGVNAAVLQHFQKARGLTAMRPVIESDGGVWPLDVTLTESDPSGGRRNRRRSGQPARGRSRYLGRGGDRRVRIRRGRWRRRRLFCPGARNPNDCD